MFAVVTNQGNKIHERITFLHSLNERRCTKKKMWQLWFRLFENDNDEQKQTFSGGNKYIYVGEENKLLPQI